MLAGSPSPHEVEVFPSICISNSKTARKVSLGSVKFKQFSVKNSICLQERFLVPAVSLPTGEFLSGNRHCEVNSGWEVRMD